MTTSAGSRPVVFVHVAKTAGTSLTRVLQAALPPERLTVRTHRPVATLPTADHAHAVAVIREPLDRLVSAFAWLHRRPSVLWHGAVGNADLVAELGLDRFADGADFLERFDLFYEDRIRPYADDLAACDRRYGDLMTFGHFNLFVPQHRYLADGAGRVVVPDLLRFAHLQSDVAAYLDRVAPGHPEPDWPHLYASGRGPAAALASPRALAAVRDVYAGDYALPGMPSPPEPGRTDATPPAAPAALTRAVLRLRALAGCPCPAVGDEPAVALLRDLGGSGPSEAAAADAVTALPEPHRRTTADAPSATAVLLAWAWEMRAVLQETAGEAQPAVISLCRAVAAAPDAWPARLRLAGLRLAAGDRRVALEEMRRLRDLVAARPDPDLLAGLADLARRAGVG